MKETRLKQLLSNWVALCWQHGQLVLFTLLLTTMLAGSYAVSEFRMVSKLGELIRQDGNWKTQWDDYKAQFPSLIETVIVVVSSDSRAKVDYVTAKLSGALSNQPNKYSEVFSPAAEPFMRERALLYLSADDLEQVSARLIEAQPMLTRFAKDPSLRGVLELIIDGVNQEPPEVVSTHTVITGKRLTTGAAVKDRLFVGRRISSPQK